MEHESIIRKFFRYRKKLKPQNQKISKKDNNIQTIALKSETEKEKYWEKRNANTKREKELKKQRDSDTWHKKNRLEQESIDKKNNYDDKQRALKAAEAEKQRIRERHLASKKEEEEILQNELQELSSLGFINLDYYNKASSSNHLKFRDSKPKILAAARLKKERYDEGIIQKQKVESNVLEMVRLEILDKKYKPDFSKIEGDTYYQKGLLKLKIHKEYNKEKTSILKIFNDFIASPRETKFDRELILSDKDLKLIAMWLDINSKEINTKKKIYYANKRGDQDFLKFISARYAEKAALKYYKNLERDVEDLSIQQALMQRDKQDWRTSDMRSGEHIVDVKNARRSFSSNSSFSEQYIKSFKSDDKNNPVTYLGTLSEYITIEKELADAEAKIRILGEVTEKDIHNIESWINHKSDSYIKIDLGRKGSTNRGAKGSFIPGWMFEYHPDHYQGILEIRSKIDNLESWKKSKNLKAFLPPLLMIISNSSYQLDDDDNSKNETLLIKEAIEMRNSVGISRRSIFLLVLVTSINSLKKDKTFRPSKWDNILFFENKYAFPLGMHDPEMYIKTFIDVLDDLWSKNKNSLLNYVSFKLSGTGILRGVTKQNKLETIIAYCGGWREGINGSKPCGKNPLYVGDSLTCKSCGYLICTEKECLTCSRDCKDFFQRKSEADNCL